MPKREQSQIQEQHLIPRDLAACSWNVVLPLLASAHLGLLWQRYTPKYSEVGRNGETKLAPRKQVELFCELSPKIASGLRPLIEQLHTTRINAMGRLPSFRWLRLTTLRRCAIGLANPAPAENSGVALHHTYGFPYLPASTLKGLARNYAEACCEYDNPVCNRQTIDRIFGSTTHKGLVTFYDALPDPCCDAKSEWFKRDILTVHHPKYYSGITPFPDDTESPNPVPFLTVARGVSFIAAIGLTRPGLSALPSDKEREAITNAAVRCLTGALSDWGIGAKTGSDYGRMEVKHTDDGGEP